MLRKNIINQFLAKNKIHNAKKDSLPDDASARHYSRIFDKEKSYILMEAHADQTSFIPFIKISKFLGNNNFSVPEIYATDNKYYLMLLEDFGDNSFNKTLNQHPQKKEELYRNAIDNLIKLHQITPPSDLPIHSNETLLDGIKLFCKWCLTDTSEKKQYLTLWSELLPQINMSSQIMVLRDFHADNLFWLPERTAYQKTGLIDFQDASLGHPAYDLCSLLEDARHYITPQFRDMMIEYYLKQNPEINRNNFMRDYAILSTQRNLRILGLFTKLVKKDNKVQYQKYIPNVRQYLRCYMKQEFMLNVSNWQNTDKKTA
jgi:aminoglycoside/choline kinase family phosphotransferase